jgi:hypothetical protein
VDCYTIQAPDLETVTAAFKFTSMLQGQLYFIYFSINEAHTVKLNLSLSSKCFFTNNQVL